MAKIKWWGEYFYDRYHSFFVDSQTGRWSKLSTRGVRHFYLESFEPGALMMQYEGVVSLCIKHLDTRQNVCDGSVTFKDDAFDEDDNPQQPHCKKCQAIFDELEFKEIKLKEGE